MCKVARIDAFNELWPLARWGPGHIVLEDCNLEDGHLRWCILCIVFGVFCDGHSAEELEATKKFLRELLQIPLAQRVGPGDWLCRDEP